MTPEVRQTLIDKEERILDMLKHAQPTETDDVELLMLAVEDMMKSQQAFFARKMESDKKASMAKEDRVRLLLKNFRRKGYQPENKLDKTQQTQLF